MTQLADPALMRWLATAERAARETGALLREIPASGRRITQDLANDVKLEADKDAETAIVAVLRDDGDLPILTEERGLIEGKQDPGPDSYQWIIDPVDGSVNFLRGIPFACVSIGLWKNGRPFLGCIQDVRTAETFTGIVGHGAWLDGRPITPSPARRTSDAILCIGISPTTTQRPGALETLPSTIRRFKKIRQLGSAALAMAYVAAGRVDAYFEQEVKTWDIAAGSSIVLAAGGHVELKKTSSPHSLDCLAAAPQLDLSSFHPSPSGPA